MALDSVIAELGGEQAPAPSAFSPTGNYGTDPRILDRLRGVESGGNPLAINKETKALGAYQFLPETVADLHKRGVKFNPFDEKEARAAADYYLQDLRKKSGGDMARALAAYGGFKSKDPSQYVGKVMNDLPALAPAAPAANDEALGSVISALNEPFAAEPKPKSPAAPKLSNAAEPFIKELQAAPGESLRFAGSLLAAPGAALASGYEGIWDFAKHLATGKSFDEAAAKAAEAVTARQKAVAFEPTTAEGRRLSAGMASPYNPLNWIGMAGKKVGGTLQQFGASPGVSAIAEGAVNAAPLLLGGAESLNQPIRFGAPAEVAKTTLGEIAAPTAAAEIPAKIPRQGTLGAVAAPAAAAPQPIPQGVRAQPSRGWQAGTLNEKVSTIPPPAFDLGLEIPKAGTLRAAVESEPVKGGVPIAAQSERAALAQRLGLKTVRTSAIEGDALNAATQAQTVRFNQPAGRAAAEQFQHETQALQTATAEIAAKNGGTLGVGETANFARGSKIAAIGDKLREWFDTTERTLYKTADERTKGLPVVSVEPVESLLKDRTFKNSVMARDKGHLLTAVEDQLALFKENNPQGITVKNAEQFRQWLNEQWTPETSNILGKVKGAVDKAVTAAAGEDVYGSSRAIHILKKETLENPKGIAKLWDTDPKNPINRATKIEALPQAVERMPVEQFKNVVDTLRKKVPPELKADAAAAEAEIKAHFVQGIIDAGTPNTKTPSPFWNNRRVNDYLNANRERMSYLFSKEELTRLADIRAGGNMLAVDAAYPGAAAQAQNAMKAGLLSSIMPTVVSGAGGGIGALGGAFVGQPALGATGGATLGRWLGERMSSQAGETAALKKFNKGVMTLKELAP